MTDLGEATYNVDPVDVFDHARQIKPTQVPKRRWRSERNSELAARVVKSLAQSLHQEHVVLSIIILPATIWRAGILPVNRDVNKPAGRPDALRSAGLQF